MTDAKRAVFTGKNPFNIFQRRYGVFTLAWSGTGTGKNGLYDIMQNVSHYTGTGTGEITGKNTNGCYTHFSGPENLPGDEL